MTSQTRRLSLNSVRVRLTLWNVGILALGLVGMGFIFIVSMRANLSAGTDSKLTQRAHRAQRFFLNPPPFPIRRSPRPTEPNSSGELYPRFFDARGRSVDAQGQADMHPEPSLDSVGLLRSLRGEEVHSTIHTGAEDIRMFSVPIQKDGKLLAVTQVGNSLAHVQEEETRMGRTLLTLIPLVLLIAGAGGAFLTDRALRPIRRIAQAAGKIEAENLSRRLPVIGNDEFADLAETFNGMLLRIQSAFEHQEQAFEQQRRFTADASHELRTPLSIIKANTSLALSVPRTAPDYKKTLQTVDTAADRMTRIVQDLLLLARSDAGHLAYQLVPTRLSEVLTQAMAVVQSQDHAPVALGAFPPSLRVLSHADSLVRLFTNLLENAARHTPPGGRITISVETLADVVAVNVIDTGEGIAPEHLPHLTERFYRVEEARSRLHGGTGLGLAICRSIVDAHEGDLTITSSSGKGTTVRVILVRTDDEPALVGVEVGTLLEQNKI